MLTPSRDLYERKPSMAHILAKLFYKEIKHLNFSVSNVLDYSVLNPY